MLNVQNPFLGLLLVGFGVTFLANIYRRFTSKKQFIISSLFVFWIAINSITIWLFTLINNALNINNFLLSSIIIAVGLVVSSYLVNSVHILKPKGLKIWIPIIIILVLLFFAYKYLTPRTSIITASNKIDLSSGNFVKGVVDSVKSTFSKTFESSCPQINVPIEEHSWGVSDIQGKTYDGWTVKGEATCRKGTKEGENLNMYYCGGFNSILGISMVNAYVEKTIISNQGEIGKTYKHIIWNIYDENKNFVETRCLGDPDKFEEKQAEAFERELMNWN